ncbi:MAG: hypothetical protein ABSF13_06450 [Smithella sp.]|jgi:hypothetical protein
MRFFYIIVLIMTIIGCSMPATTVRSVDSRPSIAIKGASSTAELLVDDLKMGKAETFNGEPQTLTLEPGTHKISIIDNGTIIYEQKIFVESELKTITVH